MMDLPLGGKRVLFFSPKFFGYEKEIVSMLQTMGAIVDFYDERPGNDTWIKSWIRINKLIIKKTINAYYYSIIEDTKNTTYDFVFFIHAETPTKKIIKKIKSAQPKAVFLLYMWDAFKHRPVVFSLCKYFDRIYTYDRFEAKQFQFSFLPLFYIPSYNVEEKSNNELDIDISFIGTIHSDRYFIVKNIQSFALLNNLKSYYYLFFHNKLLFYKNKFLAKGSLNSKSNEFNYSPLKSSEILKIYYRSKTVLDIQHPNNTGLTMRTLETLASNKKLITTNTDIINYDFYNPQNILIIDRKNIKLDLSFFQTPYAPVSIEIKNKYALKSWLTSIFMAK